MSSKPVSLNLDLETIALLDEAGRREGRSRSAMANRIILSALEPGQYAAFAAGVVSPARGTDLAGFKPDPKP